MSVYYQDELVTLYHGDCIDMLPSLPTFDLLLTDPPYGIGATWKGGWGHGWGKAKGDATLRNEWDDAAPTIELINTLCSLAKDSVIWGGNYFPLPPSRGWLVWNKPERNFSLAEAELAWTTRDNVIRVKDLPRSEPGREHPTQKPLSLMRWCIGMFPKAQTVLDPFAGSGTTLRAAADMGLRAVGIEREERYCEIAAKRLSQGVLDFGEVPA
jgi:site-specific DNA-methyltransferase (adenine-specific)